MDIFRQHEIFEIEFLLKVKTNQFHQWRSASGRAFDLTAVHGNYSSIHKAGPRAGQSDHSAGDFFSSILFCPLLLSVQTVALNS
jgi:hypothetical protein